MQETWIENEGTPLYLRSWRGTAKAQHIFIGHGQPTHSGTFGPLCEALNRDGYSVFAGDLRGHGRSTNRANPLGHLDPATGWAALKSDMIRLTEAAFQDVPFEDRIFIAQNISAHLAMDLMRNGHVFARRLVLVSPIPSRPVIAALARSYIKARMIQRTASAPDEQTLQRVYGFFGANISGRRHLADVLSTDPQTVQALLDDPLGFPTPTLGYWTALFNGHSKAWSWPSALQLPSKTRCLILNGSEDRAARKNNVIETLTGFFARHGVAADTRVIAGARSNVLIDEGRLPVARTIAGWLDETALPRTRPIRKASRQVPTATAPTFPPGPEELVELCHGAIRDGGGWSTIMERMLPNDVGSGAATPKRLQSLFADLMPHWERSSDMNHMILAKAARAPILSTTLDELGLGIAVVLQDGGIVLHNKAYARTLATAFGVDTLDEKGLAAYTCALLFSNKHTGIGHERPLVAAGRVAGFLVIPDEAASGSTPTGVILLRIGQKPGERQGGNGDFPHIVPPANTVASWMSSADNDRPLNRE